MATKEKSKLKLRNIDELEGALLPPPPPINPELMRPFPYPESITAAVPVGQYEYPLAESYTTQSITAAAATSYNQETLPLNTATAVEHSNQNRSEAFSSLGRESIPLLDQRRMMGGIASGQMSGEYLNSLEMHEITNPSDQHFSTAHYVPSYHEMSVEKRAQAEKEMTQVGSIIGRISNETSNEAIKKGLRDTNAREWQIKEQIRVAAQNAKKRDKEDFTMKRDPYFKEFPSKSTDEKTTHYQENKKEGYEVSDYEVSDYSGMNYDTTYEYKSIYDK